MHICIASDDNYYENLIVLLTSLVEKVPKTNHSALNIYLLVNEKYSKSVHTFEIFKDIKITYVRISDLELNDAKATSYFSEATYFKLFIDKFYFKGIEKLLYLDSDIMIVNDISEIFKLDIEDNMIASVFERKNSFSKKRIDVEPEKYFNAGVILFNLNKIPFSYFSEMRKGMKKNYKFLDQDILNIAFSKDNTFISEKWNFHRYYSKKMFYLKKNFDDLDVRILHYNGSIKPWNKEDFVYLREIYSNYYLKVFGRTLIFKEITRFERTKNNIRKIVDYIKFKFLEV